MNGILSAGMPSPLRPPVLFPWFPKTGAMRPLPPRLDQKAGGLKVVLIGNALPRRCGIATFTTDLEHALHATPDVRESAIVAMTDPGQDYLYPAKVCRTLHQNHREDYRAAADYINAQAFDVACLQHEFGIFGGEAGGYILDLAERLTVPLIITLHTVLDHPTPAQRHVMARLLALCAGVVVMARKGREILIHTYGVDPADIRVILHGIPDVAWSPPTSAKARLGFGNRSVILTFGLIGPGKGIETMIEAMPSILVQIPDAVYVVMGATHPQLLADGRDHYRETLMARVQALGIAGHVVFLNRFFDSGELLDHIGMCDVYVTPYLVEAQMTSGTLAISHGLGRPVVSTPYWHAAELLADGSGRLVPFGDSAALGACVAELLADDEARLQLGQHAYAASRPAIWAHVAQHYARLFARTRADAAAARYWHSG
jgi:glycosyltransferase involved in cell wall biosynthesis